MSQTGCTGPLFCFLCKILRPHPLFCLSANLRYISTPFPVLSGRHIWMAPKEQPDEYNIDNFNWYTGGVEERESEDDYNDLYDFNFYTGEESTYDEDLADADKASGK